MPVDSRELKGVWERKRDVWLACGLMRISCVSLFKNAKLNSADIVIILLLAATSRLVSVANLITKVALEA